MYRVLIIDDIEDNRDLLSSILEALGYDSDTAFDGQKAINMLRHDKYDLIITDVIMPIKDGYEVAKFVREELPEDKQSTPIIAMSGGGAMLTKEIALSGIRLFADKIIKKPFSVEEIELAITELLPTKIPENYIATAHIKSAE